MKKELECTDIERPNDSKKEICTHKIEGRAEILASETVESGDLLFNFHLQVTWFEEKWCPESLALLT